MLGFLGLSALICELNNFSKVSYEVLDLEAVTLMVGIIGLN